MLRTPICDLFGIDYPILLAGMGGVSMAPLVAAVSNAGGLGVMGAAALSPDHLRAEIRKTKALTRKPFAVDLLTPLPQMIVPYLPILYEEEVEIFVAGLAVPEQDETIRTRAYSGKPLRALKNPYIAELESDPAKMRPFPEQLMISSQRNVMAYWNPEADPERTCFPAGQGVGAFREIKPAGEVLREIVAQAEAVLGSGVFAPNGQ